MSRAKKTALLILGAISALLIVSQFVMGMLILSDPGSLAIRKSHQHSGYLTAAVVFVYIAISLIVIASSPRKDS